MTHTPRCCVSIFLSTLSLRRATTHHFPALYDILISIHALLAESDDTSKDVIKTARNFYPRSPCGERRISTDARLEVVDFYPRSPCGERRPTHAADGRALLISIHALLAESDWPRSRSRPLSTRFLSTLSLRRATLEAYTLTTMGIFLSTLSLRRATKITYPLVTPHE